MSLSTTALHGLHEELGGRLVDFAGWELPVQFAGIIAEHQHTRKSASLFDVSHMGQVLIYPESGNLADAAAALETLIPASVAGLKEGRQRYGLFTDENGGVLDDLMFANHGDRYFLVVNAARSDHDLGLLRTLERVTVEHITDRSLLALQGPRAEEALAGLIPDAAGLRFMDSRILDWDGVTVWVSRSGYTGEDGFEISVPSAEAERLASRVLIMNEGRIIADGTVTALRELLDRGSEITWIEDGARHVHTTHSPERFVRGLDLDAITGLTITRPTLEETYLSLVNKEPRP